ncbi:MAG: 4a-hydroxytetrahydrobiopterin dehydratase [Sphingobium sp.]
MVTRISADAVASRIGEIPGWRYDTQGEALVREIKLKDFSEAFALMTRIAIAAEQADHHPEWSNVYNRITIRLTTHDADGVSERDFALAARINAFLGE